MTCDAAVLAEPFSRLLVGIDKGGAIVGAIHKGGAIVGAIGSGRRSPAAAAPCHVRAVRLASGVYAPVGHRFPASASGS